MPIPGLNRAVVQAINVGRSVSDDVRAVYITDDPEEAAKLRADFERQVPGVPLVVVESPYRALVGPAARLPRRPRLGLAAGQAVADHVRRHPRVRRAQLVGADPLQPVGQAAADGPARAAAYRGRGRPVPARGPGAVRGGPGRTSVASARPAATAPGPGPPTPTRHGRDRLRPPTRPPDRPR